MAQNLDVVKGSSTVQAVEGILHINEQDPFSVLIIED